MSGCIVVPYQLPTSDAPTYAAPTYVAPAYAAPQDLGQSNSYAPPGVSQVQPGYAPQSGYAPSPQTESGQAAYGSTCQAGFYTCSLDQSLPIGAPCSCPGLGAPSYGTVR